MINFKIFRLTTLIIALFFTASCINSNSMKPTDFKNTEPTMTIEQYFNGPVKAWGLLQDRSGKVTRQFKADMTGSFEGDILTLKEDFYWTDGETQNRIWKIKKILYKSISFLVAFYLLKANYKIMLILMV